ncbi:MAG: class I SAM-dependent methyltransferase [Lachnospiraceae bacterium]|nr:class I SAM-dependent methyltransferase [Lachnospiraceae bacterium]
MAVKDYRNVVDQPWGKMFYDLVYRQLDLPEKKRLKILDFGAGFCLTADHYAKDHDVIAVEPNEEMRNLRVQNNAYTLIPQGEEYLSTLEDASVDVIICHNVLEYVADMDPILKQFERILKPDGVISIVKHNDLGRVVFYAVLNDDPKAALELLDKEEDEGSIFGSRKVYTGDTILSAFSGKMSLADSYGIRTFYGLSSNNEIKFTEEWYHSMLELEMRAGSMEEYKNIAFFHHLIFRKK